MGQFDFWDEKTTRGRIQAITTIISTLLLLSLFYCLSCFSESNSAENLQLKLSTEKETYELHEPIILHLELSNIGDTPIKVDRLPTYFGHYLIFIFTDEGGSEETISNGSESNRMIEVPIIINPNETVEAEDIQFEIPPKQGDIHIGGWYKKGLFTVKAVWRFNYFENQKRIHHTIDSNPIKINVIKKWWKFWIN